MMGLSPEHRAYVLERLDRGHIEQLAGKVRDLLEAGHPAAVEYMPGDATRYSLVFVPPRPAFHATGGGSMGYGQRERIADVEHGDDMEEHACRLSPNRPSALAIAELLKAVFAR